MLLDLGILGGDRRGIPAPGPEPWGGLSPLAVLEVGTLGMFMSCVLYKLVLRSTNKQQLADTPFHHDEPYKKIEKQRRWREIQIKALKRKALKGLYVFRFDSHSAPAIRTPSGLPHLLE